MHSSQCSTTICVWRKSHTSLWLDDFRPHFFADPHSGCRCNGSVIVYEWSNLTVKEVAMRKAVLILAVAALAFAAGVGVASYKPEAKYSVKESGMTMGGGKAASTSFAAEDSITTADAAGVASSSNYSVEPVTEITVNTSLDWMEFERDGDR
jgi:hypothetical protein